MRFILHGAFTNRPWIDPMLHADINSSSVNETDTMGARTDAYSARPRSPSAPAAYSGSRHQRRHCAITPRGRSPTFRRALPGKYPNKRMDRGATTYHSHHTAARSG